MKPRVLKIDPRRIDPKPVRQAAKVIRDGGLVAFPTETVYGLGANALDPEAVAGIFEAKKRPLDNPLIVHIVDPKDMHRLAKKVPSDADKLVDRFWPGPLTVVLKKTDLVPDIVTTGLDTVGIRMPSNVIAREFITASGVPIAAPSANIFGRPSPTTAMHVIEDLDGRIDVVLDGGSTEIGIESTVVEFVNGRVIVLRPGGIDMEQLHTIVKNVKLSSGLERSGRSPGEYPQHYSPNAGVVLIEDGSSQVERVISAASAARSRARKIGIMAKQEHAHLYKGFNVKVLGPEGDGRTCASRLFHILREFDAENVDFIVAEGIPEKGIGLAVMNRLKKAASPASNSEEGGF
jgi:L-threonylcarbamoyladenylate synthase